jgi:hypothetical protein
MFSFPFACFQTSINTESESDGLSTNQNPETIDQSTSSNVMRNTHNSTASDVTENCAQQITKTDNCLLKCNLLIKQVEDEQVMIEMSWIDGTVHESMNQVVGSNPVEGRTKIDSSKNLILTLFGLIFRRIYIKNDVCPREVITKLTSSEQSYKGKVQTHNYINRQNQ